MFVLTRENYHSQEANRLYMSHSQYANFLQCEAMAMAKLTGDWKEEQSDALLVGSYVHAWSEGTLEQFKANNPDCYTKKGELTAKMQQAERMIDCLKKDEFCMFVLQGEKEVIMTAEFAGATWRVMMDVYTPEKGRFVDLKTTRSISETQWNAELGERISFVEMYHYPRQFALYSEIERLATGRQERIDPIVVAVSKEDPPDKAIISMADHDRAEMELQMIRLNMPHILAVKHGIDKPSRCEKCDYCRATKVVSKIIHYSKLAG